MNLCYGTLAVEAAYRQMALRLHDGLSTIEPRSPHLIVTDAPDEFDRLKHAIPIRFDPDRPLNYHDKRIVIEEGLDRFDTVISIDADSNVKAPFRLPGGWCPGITVKLQENLVTHNKRMGRRDRNRLLRKLVAKEKLWLKNCEYFTEMLYAVTRDDGRERVFLSEWRRLADLWIELSPEKNGRGSGNIMGLAAAKAGWRSHVSPLDVVDGFIEHHDASKEHGRL